MNFKKFYIAENKAVWLGSCINFRKKSTENENTWHTMMANKKEVPESEFLKNVNIEDLLDDGETWEIWKENNSDDDIKLYKSGNYYFIQTKGFEYIWCKKLNESILNEDSQDFNIAKVLATKLLKLLDEIEYSANKNPKYLNKYKYSNSGMYHIPLKDFIKDMNFSKDSIFSHIEDGKLYLEHGYRDESPTPYLLAISSKDGRVTRNKSGAYFDPSPDFLGIHLPYIDPKTNLPYQGYRNHWKSLLIHEFTHYVQDAKERFGEGTSTLSSDEWYSNKKEQEAYLHELYALFQTWLADEIRELKSLRDEDISKYVKKNNRLVELFSSEETFEKKYPVGEILLDNDKQKRRINYLAGNLKDVYKKFILDTYNELKKEFKNVLPTKKLKYGDVR